MQMKKGKQIYTFRHIASSLLMLAMLAWLTVCLPLVNQSAKSGKAQTGQTSQDSKTDNSNPLNNTNEEKSESGTSLLSEYIHEVPVMERHFILLSSVFRGHPSDLYIAFHPDMIIPPPEA